MADFNHAYLHSMAREGGYANHAADRGGETYKGIARAYWPEWTGWQQIDAHFKLGGNRHTIERLPGLEQRVAAFYHEQFWTPLRGDLISSQAVAEELFDSAVNAGKKTAVRWLQQSINLLGNLGSDIAEDGEIGPVTIAALEAVLAKGFEASVLKAQNVFQGMHYVSIVERDPSQRVFIRGWLKRV